MTESTISQSEMSQLLKTTLNNPDAKFRQGQREAIRALVEEKAKLLVVQRTGWGKSERQR